MTNPRLTSQALTNKAHYIWAGIGLLVSLGVHALLLGLPVPPSPEPDEAVATSDSDSEELLSVVILPKSAPAPALPETEVVADVPEPPPSEPQQPESTLESPPPIEIPPEKKPPEEPLPQAAPPEPEPVTQPETPPPEPEPVEPQVPPEPQPYADFPHLGGGEVPCEGREHCWRTQEGRRAVASTLEADLEAQGYEVSLFDSEQSGVHVYVVEKDKAIEYYLTVIASASFDGGSFYVLTEERMTEAELDEVRGV